MINYDTFKAIAELQQLVVRKPIGITRAANGTIIEMIGYTEITFWFDSDAEFPVTATVAISSKSGCNVNLLGLEFVSHVSDSMLFNKPILRLENIHPGKFIRLHTNRNIEFPYYSKIKKVQVGHTRSIPQKSLAVIKLQTEAKKGTHFVPHKRFAQNGIFFFDSYCTADESEFPVMVENMNTHEITLKDGNLGYLSEPGQVSKLFHLNDGIKFLSTIKDHTLDDNDIHYSAMPSWTEYKVTENYEPSNTCFKAEEELATDFYEEAKACDPNRNKPKKPKIPIPTELLHKYSNRVRQFLNKFDFTDSDLTKSELAKLLDILVEDSDVYSFTKYDIGKIAHEFKITLQKDAQFRKQRPSKIPFHYRDRLEKLLVELQEAEIIKEMGDEEEMGSSFINPIIILPKGDSLKIVIDARFLNSITDLTTYYWPLEPLNVLLTKISGKIFTTSDLSYAYSQVPLSKETQKLTSFVIGNKQYTFTRGFYGLAGLPNFFSRIMSIHFAPMIRKKTAITYLDDCFLQAKTKQQMFQVIKEYHSLLRKSGLKAAPDKTFMFLKKVKFLGHQVSEKGLSPLTKRVQALRQLKSPESKRDVMRVIGCLQFYSCYIRNLNVTAKPLFDLIAEGVNFKWTDQHEQIFQEIKNQLCEDTLLTFPDQRYPFHIHVDSSSVGTGYILIQEFPEGKKVVSYNSRIFDKQEQKETTTHRELCGIISALQAYEHYIIGSPHPIYVYCDHKPIIYLWARKGQLSHRFFRYQVIITKFQNLKIIWTPGKNLPIPDILSRNVTNSQLRQFQLSHKVIPKDIEFLDSLGNTVKYYIEHETDQTTSQNDYYPVICEYQGTKSRLRIKNNGEEVTVEKEPMMVAQVTTELNSFFKDGKSINNRQLERQKALTPPEPLESESDTDSEPDDYWYEDAEIAINIAELKSQDNSETQPITVCAMSPQKSSTNAVEQLQELTKTQELDTETIIKEQGRDPILSQVISWVKQQQLPDNTPKLRHSKTTLRI